jgi:hypothetical protein
MSSPTGENWLERESTYKFLLAPAIVSDEDYRAAIAEVLDTFPVSWAREIVEAARRERPNAGCLALRPSSNSRFAEHPVAFLIHAPEYAPHNIAILFSLGRDLHITGSLPGIRRVRARLRVLKEYLGALFELEVAATLLRCGSSTVKFRKDTPDIVANLGSNVLHVEAKYRSPRGGRVVANGIMPPFGAEGHFEIEIVPDDNPSLLAARISEEIGREWRAHSGQEFQLEKPGYAVNYDPKKTITQREESEYRILGASALSGDGRSVFIRSTGAPRVTWRIRFKSSAPGWEAELSSILYQDLQHKASKLRLNASPQTRSLIAIDCRSLLPSVPTWSASRNQNAERNGELEKVLFEGATACLQNNPETWGVLIWLESAMDQPVNPAAHAIPNYWAGRVVIGPVVGVVTRSRSAIVRDESALAAVLTQK